MATRGSSVRGKMSPRFKQCTRIIKRKERPSCNFYHYFPCGRKSPCSLDQQSCTTDPSEKSADDGSNILSAVNVQLELLQHELHLAKHKVKERNVLVDKLENLLQSENQTMKHLCEDPSLIKAVDLIHDAIHLQDEQYQNVANLKRRIEALEVPSSPCCRNMIMTCCEKETNCRTNRHSKGHNLINNKETTQKTVCPPSFIDASTNTCEIPFTPPVVNECENCRSYANTIEELTKQKTTNRQLNQRMKFLEAEGKSYESTVKILNEKNNTLTKAIEKSESKEKALHKTIVDLKEENDKLMANIRRIDNERDKIVKELDFSEESLSKLKSQLMDCKKQLNSVEIQYDSIVNTNRQLHDLLENSEQITNDLKRQKIDLAKEFGKSSGKLAALEKSYDSLKFKHQHCSKHLKKYKKELAKSNDEKKVMQSQLQEYVNKVRLIEDLLLQKEQEREFVFEQFKGMGLKSSSFNCTDSASNIKANANSGSNYGEELSFEAIDEQSNRNSFYQHKLKGLHQELMTEKRMSQQLHDVIKSTREEAMTANMKNEELTNQLSNMRVTVQNLEGQIKTIADSLESYQKDHDDLESSHPRDVNDVSSRRWQRTRSESSHSTML